MDPSDKNHLPSSLIKTYFQLFEVAVRKSQTTEKGPSSSHSMKGRLLSALLTGVNRTRPFLSTKNLVMEEHVEALYRIAHTSPPATATQAMMLLFHLSTGPSVGTNKNRQDRFYRALYSKLMDSDMFSGRQVTLLFNLVYKSMKNDHDSDRIMAFSKRLLHTAAHQSAAVCAGTLFLLSEVGKYQPIINDSIATCRNSSVFDCTKREPLGAFKPMINTRDDKDNETMGVSNSLWELCLCATHYHPTVVKFTRTMSDIQYEGDPLRDISLTHFLDKFAFRNPKSVDKIAKQLKRGESVGERRSGIEGKLSSLSSIPVNNPEYWSKQGGTDVSESDDFFKTFFCERAKRDEAKGVLRNRTDEDDDYALDIAEGREVDFDGDDTDSDEEAFVQRLAQQLIESSGKGKAHYDDEDPDMDDWGDLEDETALDDDDEIEVEQYDRDANEDDFDDDDDGSDIQNEQGAKCDNIRKSVFAAAEDYDNIIAESISRSKRKMVDGSIESASRKKR